jgi:hypothetical protein
MNYYITQTSLASGSKPQLVHWAKSQDDAIAYINQTSGAKVALLILRFTRSTIPVYGTRQLSGLVSIEWPILRASRESVVRKGRPIYPQNESIQ